MNRADALRRRHRTRIGSEAVDLGKSLFGSNETLQLDRVAEFVSIVDADIGESISLGIDQLVQAFQAFRHADVIGLVKYVPRQVLNQGGLSGRRLPTA